jgi:hypothetical protein
MNNEAQRDEACRGRTRTREIAISRRIETLLHLFTEPSMQRSARSSLQINRF